jgi:hypothetical protein
MSKCWRKEEAECARVEGRSAGLRERENRFLAWKLVDEWVAWHDTGNTDDVVF